MLKLPVLTEDLIAELAKAYPVKPLTLKDIKELSKEEIAFHAGERAVVDQLLMRLNVVNRDNNNYGVM